MSPVVLDREALPARQRARRKQILDAATDLLRQREYDTIEVRDVARAGGVALATVYRYFPSKELLFGSVLAEWASGFPRAAGASGGSVATTEAEIRASMRRVVRAYEQFPQMVRVLMMLESSTDPRIRDVFLQFAGHHVGSIVGSLSGVEPSTARAIVDTAYAVMNTKLRAWAVGLITIRQVDTAVRRCLDLVFSPPPLH